MSLLSIGKSGLYAAQAGLATTGNNITNSNVDGYSRETTVQATSISQGNSSTGYIGTGTQVTQVKRYADEFLNSQVRTATASSSALDTYQTQIEQIDNLLSDSTTGLTPALQDFFSSVQNLTGDTAGVSSRGSMLSSASTLASSFQNLSDQLDEINDGVNTQITSGVDAINTYASQIASLNDQIAKATDSTGLNAPNDLLDQRDQMVIELNKQIKATVTQGDNNSYTVTIGNGQPLVSGTSSFQLAAIQSPTDQTQMTIGYVTNNKTSPLAESALTGGALGAVLQFRSQTLAPAQNSLGRIAIAMASTLNAQNELGLDGDGNPGTAIFQVATPEVTANVGNNPTSTTSVTASISDVSQLTTSDYEVKFDGTNYNVTRLSDNKKTVIDPYPQTQAQTIDGIDFSITGNAAAGDDYMVRPTANGASDFNLLLTDGAQIAAAAPIATSVPLTNTGNAAISAGSVDKDYLSQPLTSGNPVTLTYSKADGALTGFPDGKSVTVTGTDGKATTYAAGQTVPYQSGASYTVGGMSFTITGTPGDGDTYKIAHNTGTGDTRNASLMGDLQSTNILDGGKATYESAYANLVSTVGNKTREVQTNASAASTQLASAQGAADNVSGVNLDEEAANLLKYQQAYQAAAKIMSTADTIFQSLLSIGS